MARSNPHIDVEALLGEAEWLQRLARRLLGDVPDADDLSQEALHRAMRSGAPAGVDRSGLRRWLGRIARNLFLEERRAGARRNAREADVARPDVQEDDALDRASLRRDVLDAVLRLPEPERTAVVLRYLEAVPYPELAQRQGVSEVAARKRVSRGIDRLRAQLDADRGGRAAWSLLLAPYAADARPAAAALVPPATVSTVFAMGLTAKVALGGALVLAAGLAFVALRGPASTETRLERVAAEDAVVLEDIEAAEPVREAAAERPKEGVAAAVASSAPRAAFPTLGPEASGTLVLRVAWADGSPAEGITVRVLPWGSNDADLEQRRVRTDASGRATCEGLAPGNVSFYPDRCSGGGATLRAGSVTTCDLTLPEGSDATGRVLDPTGAPVRGATISLSAYGNTGHGCVVGMSDDDGRYAVWSVGPGRHISARHPDWGPSAQEYAGGAEGAEVERDLVLRGGAGRIDGRVADGSGRPVAGARVRIAEPEPGLGSEPVAGGRGRKLRPLPREVRTDGRGHFEIDGVATGSVRLSVRARGLVPWAGEAAVSAGDTTHVEVVLSDGCVLDGIVRFADGTPADGATVWCEVPGSGVSVRARAAGDGTYRLVGMSPGLHEVTASADDRGRAVESLWFAPEAPTRWDVELVEGDSVRGRVVDARGEALSGWVVGFTSGDGVWYGQARTAADGSFRLTDIPARARDLSVGPPDWLRVGASVVTARSAVLGSEGASAEPLTIVVPDEAMHTGSARLRVLVDGVAASRETVVGLWSTSPFSNRSAFPDAEGVVHFARLRPGAFTLRASLAGRADRRLEFEVRPHGAVDLGTLELVRGGRVEITLSGTAAGKRFHASVVSGPSVGKRWIQQPGEPSAAPRLQPGLARLRIEVPGHATSFRDVSVVEGETVDLRLDPPPGVARILTVSSADGEPLGTMWKAVVRQRSGVVVTDGAWTTPHPKDAPADRTRIDGLVPGDYDVEAVTRDGRTATGSFEVTDLEPSDAPVLELELR